VPAASGWRVADTVYPGNGDRDYMSSVSAPGGGDVWTVGASMTGTDKSFPVLRHWNGRTWTSVAMPRSFEGVPFQPYQVAAASASNVWVFTSSPGASAMTSGGRWAHWNGRSWTMGTLPTILVAGNDSPQVVITAAAQAGTGDVWVGGTVLDGQSKFGLPAAGFLDHFDGHGWRTYRLPASTPSLAGISALSRTDIWAAATGGQGSAGIGQEVSTRNVLLHWNGSSWRSIPAPKGVYITDVAGLSAHGAWVTGEVPGKGPDHLTFAAGAAYWNGSRWTIVPDPAADAQFAQVDYVYELTGVVTDGRGGLWAVAEPYPPLLSSLPGPAALWHYTGGHWTSVALSGLQLSSKGELDLLQLARAPGSTSVWAVGTDVTQASPGYPQDGSILRYQG